MIAENLLTQSVSKHLTGQLFNAYTTAQELNLTVENIGNCFKCCFSSTEFAALTIEERKQLAETAIGLIVMLTEAKTIASLTAEQ